MLDNLVLAVSPVQNPVMTAMHYRIIITFALFAFIALLTSFVSYKMKRAEKIERDVDQLIREEQLMFREAKQDIRKIADREAREVAELKKSIEYYKRKSLEVDLLAAKHAGNSGSNGSNGNSNNQNNGNRNNQNNGNRNNNRNGNGSRNGSRNNNRNRQNP